MSLNMEELVAEKEKLEGDRKALVENLQKLKQQAALTELLAGEILLQGEEDQKQTPTV